MYRFESIYWIPYCLDIKDVIGTSSTLEEQWLTSEEKVLKHYLGNKKIESEKERRKIKLQFDPNSKTTQYTIPDYHSTGVDFVDSEVLDLIENFNLSDNTDLALAEKFLTRSTPNYKFDFDWWQVNKYIYIYMILLYKVILNNNKTEYTFYIVFIKFQKV